MDYTKYKSIKVEKKGKIVILTLNRPQRLNAFDRALHQELEDILRDVAADEEVRVAVLTGAGRAFSSGGDLKASMEWISQHGPESPQITMEMARNLIHNILNLEKPIIAAVNGDAVGLGATIALFCDIVFAEEKARIGDTHIRVGVVPGDGGAVVWPLLVGIARAKEFLFTGDLISAKEAERLGLINHAVSGQEELFSVVMALAQRLADGPAQAIRWTKISVNKYLQAMVNLIFDASISLEFQCMLSEEKKEAQAAFLEKRPPRFR